MQNWMRGASIALVSAAVAFALSQMMRDPVEGQTPDASIFFHAGMISWKLGQRIPAQKHLYQALSLNSYFHPLHAEIAAETLKLLGAVPASPPEPSSAGSAGAALKG